MGRGKVKRSAQQVGLQSEREWQADSATPKEHCQRHLRGGRRRRQAAAEVQAGYSGSGAASAGVIEIGPDNARAGRRLAAGVGFDGDAESQYLTKRYGRADQDGDQLLRLRGPEQGAG